MVSDNSSVRKAHGNANKPALVITDYTGWRSLLNPLWCYNGFRMAVVGLTCFGLIMVFSSSTVTMAAQGKSPFVQLLNQGVFCILGLIVGFFAMVMPVGFWKRIGLPLMLCSILVQALTFTPLGIDVYGNRGWLNLGFTTIQPAEFMKFALCVWLPTALRAAKKLYRKQGMKAYTVPLGVSAVGLLTVIGGKDLGTAMILIFIGIVAFLIAGFPGKWMGIGVLVMAAMVAVLAISSPNRMRRILATYGDCSAADAQTVCYQSMHAKYAIASGGFLGVGIGNSREKWNYLPAAHNDFIFAIIGEETGFVGCAIVLLFFAILGWCMIVVALQVADRYVSIVLMCVTIWIVGQAMVNIGVVVGVFPVLGVPMPFVSAGGSSMVMCLAAAGLSSLARACRVHSVVMTQGAPHIVLAGGGTAGHVNPLLAVAGAIRELEPAAQVTVIGTAVGLEKDLVPQAGYELDTIEKVPFPRRPNAYLLQFPAKWKRETAKVRTILESRHADVVAGFGGYASAPVYATAHKMDIPIAIHEQNARAGMANKLGARWADFIGTVYDETGLKPRKGAALERVGLPLRPAIAALSQRLEVDREGVRKESAAELGIDPNRPVVVVTGGSLGAQSLNRAIASSAADLLAHAQIIHLTGRGKSDEVRSMVSKSVKADVLTGIGPDSAGQGDYHVAEYLERIDLAFACADLVICRAGAGSVSELAALGLPAIYVPLPIGNGEQRFNAEPVVNAGGGLLVADKDLTPARVHDDVPGMLADHEMLAELGRKAWEYGIRDAARIMARRVLQLAQ